jgi:hypothetical protein
MTEVPVSNAAIELRRAAPERPKRLDDDSAVNGPARHTPDG